MSKGPEGDGSRRKRRGGLRVPSDEVPRRSSSEVAAPVPEAVGLAASVSESFGVSDPSTEVPTDEFANSQSATNAETDELPTTVSDRTAADAAEASAKAAMAARLGGNEEVLLSTTDLRATIPMSSRPVHVAESDEPGIPVDEDSVDEDEEVIDNLEASSLVTGEIRALPEEDAGIESDESGESVDIPFDDTDETTVNSPIPEDPIMAEKTTNAVTTEGTEAPTIEYEAPAAQAAEPEVRVAADAAVPAAAL